MRSIPIDSGIKIQIVKGCVGEIEDTIRAGDIVGVTEIFCQKVTVFDMKRSGFECPV